MPELSDQECLAILSAKPREFEPAEIAFRLLIDRYDRYLQSRLACRYPSLRSDLADVGQEAWLRVWNRLDGAIPAEKFRVWLFRIGDNLAIDLIRKKGIRSEAALGEIEFESGQANHVHELGFRESLQACVEKLTPNHRAFLDRLFNLETAEEIAAALRKNRARIYQIKHEISQQLIACLGWQP